MSHLQNMILTRGLIVIAFHSMARYVRSGNSVGRSSVYWKYKTFAAAAKRRKFFNSSLDFRNSTNNLG